MIHEAIFLLGALGILAFPDLSGLVLLAAVLLHGVAGHLIGERKKAVVSVLLLSLFSMLYAGVRFGIDFTGGTRIPVFLERPLSSSDMAEVIQKIKTRASAFGLSEVRVVPVGNDRLYVEVPYTEEEVLERIGKLISEQGRFVAVVGGEIVLEGREIVPGSVGLTSPRDADWAVAFMVTPEAGKEFAEKVKGKAYYPVYMFLDPLENTSICVRGGLENLSRASGISQEELRRALAELLSPFGVSLGPPCDVNVSPPSLEENPLTPHGFFVKEWKEVGLLSSPLLSPELASGSPVYTYVISGEAGEEGALAQAKKVMSLLKGGMLPVKITLGSATKVGPTLGKEFLVLSGIALLIALSSVALVIALRYRWENFLPILGFAIAEMLVVFAILGSFSVDLSAMAGVIAFVGTSTDAEIILTDEFLKTGRTKEGWKVVLINGLVAAVSMLPLLFSGLVEIIGFATATVLGIAVGLLITRPAYSDFLEGKW